VALAWIALISGPGWAADPILRLSAAELILDDTASPPPETAPWQPQSLPDNWNRSRPGVGGNAWYRVQFALPREPDQLHAVYVRKVSMNAAFYVNGTLVGAGGRFEEPVARQWNWPQFYGIPSNLLKQGDNVLHVRLWVYPNSRGGLDEIRLGPEAELRPEYERRVLVQTVLPALCYVAVVAVGLFVFALWVRRRGEPTYVYLFVMSLLFMVPFADLVVRDIPVPTFYWDLSVYSTFGWCSLLFNVFLMRYLGLHWPRFERLLALYGAFGPILMYLAGPARLHAVANGWLVLMIPVGLFFGAFVIRQAWRERTLEAALPAIAYTLVVGATIQAGLVHRDKLAFDSFYLLPYFMMLANLVFGWTLTNRFVQALKVAETLNIELEQRVAEKHRELAQNFARLQELERRTAVAEERRRLMSEMHDGIGSQLIATLDLVEHGEPPRAEIAAELREVLDGVRLTIDSMEPADNDLLTVRGNLRYRLEGRLKRQGIALDWQVRDIPKLDSLTPQNVLHILRIVQEAFTNIVKHARASTITVETGASEEHVFIRVSDDGCGFAQVREGRGLASMRRRAHYLGAQLDITPSPGGTALQLSIPRAA
jgi:signal transduction histidine kinase